MERGAEFAATPEPESWNVPGVGRLWELFGVIRETRDGGVAEVAAFFQATAEEDLEAQRKQENRTEMTFLQTTRGPVVAVDLELRLPGATRVRRRRRWLAARWERDRYRVWTLDIPGPPYQSPREIELLREEYAGKDPESRFRVLVSTTAFTQACRLDPERAQTFLEALMADPTCEPGRRLAACMSLEYLPPGQAAAALERLSHDDDQAIRRIAVGALWRLDRERALPPLIQLARDGSWQSVDFFFHLEGAADALPLLAREGVADVFEQCYAHLVEADSCDLAVPGLLAALKSPGDDLREWAFQELCALGDWRLHPLLMSRLREAEEAEQEVLLAQLARLPVAETWEVLTEHLDHSSAVLRAAACREIGRTLVRNPAVVDPLLHCALRDESEEVRDAAWTALRRYGGEVVAAALAGGHTSPLTEALCAADWLDRLRLTRAQIETSPPPPLPLETTLPPVEEILTGAFESPAGPVRTTWLTLLEGYGETGGDSLQNLLDHPVEATQLLAVYFIGELGLRHLAPALEKRTRLLSRHSRLVKRAAAAALAKLQALPENAGKWVFPFLEQRWSEQADETAAFCRLKLENYPVLAEPLFTPEGDPVPWQVVFGGGVSPGGDPLLGRPVQASARGTLESVCRLIRTAVLRHWHSAWHTDQEPAHKPHATAQPTPGGYLLFALDFPVAGKVERPLLLGRTDQENFLLWVVEAPGRDPMGDPRGRD